MACLKTSELLESRDLVPTICEKAFIFLIYMLLSKQFLLFSSLPGELFKTVINQGLL